MIESIDLEGRQLHMRSGSSAKGESFNIFSADSFNIIIGDNGAGKTRALKNIVGAMRHEGQALGCDVHFSGDGDPLAEVGKFGVAYYTSIPYYVDLPADDERFKNASLPFGEEDCFSRVDVQQFADVSAALNIKTRPMIAMSCNYSLILPTLARTLVRSVSQENAVSPELDQLFPLSDIRERSGTLLKALGLPLRNPDPAEIARRKISKQTLALAHHLCHRIADLIRERCGARDIVMLSAFEAVARLTKDITALSIVFFDQVLDIHLGPASRFTKITQNLHQQLDYFIREKTRIFEAEANWKMESDSQSVSVKAEYKDSNILRLHPESELKKFVTIDWANFSSGQLAIFYQFTALWQAAKAFHENGLVKLLLLVDEGDIFLHTSWQRQYVELFDNFITKLRKEFGFETIQVILTTHSSAVITDIPGKFILRLTRGRKTQAPVLGFAAAPQDIMNSSFSTDAIGSFAQKLLTKTARNIRKNGPSESDKYVISLIDDPVIKREYLRLSALSSVHAEGDD